jgi:hypothetical protein
MTHLLLQFFSHLEQMTGPNPTDRGKLETKRHILTDQDGIIPLPVVTTAANIHDVKSAVRVDATENNIDVHFSLNYIDDSLPIVSNYSNNFIRVEVGLVLSF